MLEPMLVDRPTVRPFECAACQSQVDGPFTNYHRVIEPYGLLLICARCARADAIRRGFLDGERAEELRVVQDLAIDAEHTVTVATKALEKMTAERDQWKQRWEEDTAHMADQSDRILQLEKRLRRNAQADLELVSGGAEGPLLPDDSPVAA